MARNHPIVVLFGYTTSTFTLKTQLALKLKRVPYTFVPVPSMMPRPQLRDSFNLTYRKIPVLAIGRDLYADTSLILEALEHFFPASEGFPTLYPSAADGRDYRPIIRGFASYWMDRPLFRVACGLMPGSIWRSAFGRDREGLIGHPIDAEKLERKIPENLSRLDQQLSMLEPLFHHGPAGVKDADGGAGGGNAWIFSTAAPSLADLALFYELHWAREISSGRMTEGITAGETSDPRLEVMDPIFNMQRYSGAYSWFTTMERYFEGLEQVEEVSEDLDAVLEEIRQSPELGRKSLLLPTPRETFAELDAKNGLTEGAVISVAPDDTGKNE